MPNRIVKRDGPDHVDVHVGKRVRERRLSLGISQNGLGGYVGLPQQQILKYEQGTNRISASKLWAISHFFDVPIEWFFDGLGEPSQEQEDVMTKPEARQLAGYYLACPPHIRFRLRVLVRATADTGGKKSR